MRMWGKFGSFLFRFRYLIILITLVVGGVVSSFALKLPSILDGDGFKTKGDYQVTEKILADDFKQSRDTVIFYLEKKKGKTEEAFKQEINDLVKEIDAVPNKEFFRHPLNSEGMLKEDTAYMALLMKGKDEKQVANRSLDITEKVEKAKRDTFTVKGLGYNIINDELNRETQDGLKKAELIGIPIAFLVLLLSFGTFSASILPIITGGLSVTTTLGILYFIGQETPLSIYVLNITPMVGLALSIDFALLFVNRFREEVRDKSIRDALLVTYGTAGRAILFSALCVVVGLSGLFFFDIEFIQSVALSGMIVVFVSLLISLTLLPAALTIVGKRIAKKEKKRKPSKRKSSWAKFGELVMKRPVIMAGLVLVFIIVALQPLQNAKLGFPSTEVLPKDSATRIAFEKYEKDFDAKKKDYALVPIIVEGKKDIKEDLATAEKVVKTLEENKNVKEVTSVFSTLQATSEEIEFLSQTPEQAPVIDAVMDGFVKDNRTVLQVYLKDEPHSKEAKAWARDIEAKLKKENPDLRYYVGGEMKFEQELEDEVFNKAIPALSVILGSTFLILMFAFRSIIIPLKAIIMNILSLSATIGIVVWIFNEGHFGLDESIVLFILPIFIFGLVFGLSMDYEVFLISRIHELYEETRDNNKATLEGLVSTSKIITSAALIMIVVTGAFAFTDILPVRQMGLGIALAIFLDATIIRLILVPSLMKLLGDWNWWFPFKSKKLEKAQRKII
ncbi:MAG: MMPL family transporter [Bacillaceae bacterium]